MANNDESQPENASPTAPSEDTPADPTDSKKRSDSQDARNNSSKRSRKSANSFTPENFKDADKVLPLPHGRGQKLADLPAVVASVEGYSMNATEVLMAHRLLYATRGKPSKKLMKSNILAFYGFLPFRAPDTNKEEAEKLDEEAEVRNVLVYV